MVNNQNSSDSNIFVPVPFQWSFGYGILIVFFFLLVCWCVTMNSAVIAALLQDVDGPHSADHQWEIHFASMDVIDLCSGVFVFPLMATVVLLGYFPFPEVFCHCWVFLDYYLVVASAYGYANIMINILWMVKWPLSYLQTTKSSQLKFQLYLWVAACIVWIPPFINNYNNFDYHPTNCGFNIAGNNLYSIVLGLVGFYIPMAITLGCAVWFTIHTLKTTKDNIVNPFNEDGIFVSNNDLSVISASHMIDLLAFKQFGRENSSFYSSNGSTRIEPCQIIARKKLPVILAMLTLFVVCRAPFYIHFAESTFWAQFCCSSLSEWVYWVIHSNSPISPIVHMAFDEEIREKVYVMFSKRFKKRNGQEFQDSIEEIISDKTDNIHDFQMKD